MGLDYSYLLYFKRQHLWDALQGVADIAEHHHPPTKIIFPDHELSIPLDSWLVEENEIQYDEPEFSFSIVLNFDEDGAILDYRVDWNDEDTDRSPPQPG